MRRYSLPRSLVLLGIILASCSEVQSFPTASSQGSIGADWRAIGPDRIKVTALAISPTYPSDRTLFIGLHGWDLGVFHSADGGDSWEEVYEGLRGSLDPWVVVSPDFASDRTLFAGRGNGGVFRSTDGGDSWKKVTRGIPRYEDVGECCGYYGVSDLVFSPSFNIDSTVDPLDFRSLVFSPSFATDRTLFVWTEVGIFQLFSFSMIEE